MEPETAGAVADLPAAPADASPGDALSVSGTVAASANEAAGEAALGEAAAGEQAATLLDEAARMFEAGGPVVAILAAMSVFMVAIVLAKLWQFAAARTEDRRPGRAALALFHAGRVEDALGVAQTGRDPASAVLALAIEGEARGLPEPLIREACHREAARRVEALRGWMRPLEVIASLAPLLGLFGTVLGMIEAFSRLEAAGTRVDPSILSGGIWEALLTTAVGLAVAIPAVAAVNWFERRIERVEHAIDIGLADIFAGGWTVAAPAARAAAAPANNRREYSDARGFRAATAGE